MAQQKSIVHLGADPFGKDIKDAIKAYLEDKYADSIHVADHGVGDKYYEVANEVAKEIDESARHGHNHRGILCCGTGMGMSVIANKYPRVYAAVCESSKAAANARSINNANILTLGGMYTTEDEAKHLVEAFLATKFTDGWEDPNIQNFLKESMVEVPVLIDQIHQESSSCQTASRSQAAYQSQSQSPPLQSPSHAAAIFVDATQQQLWVPIADMNDDRCIFCKLREQPPPEGGTWGPHMRAICRFPKGAIEPPHHHTSGHDVLVLKGRKTVENLTTGETFDMGEKSFLYTPAHQVHRVTYHEDVEFYISFDGIADLFWDSEAKGVILPPAQ